MSLPELLSKQLIKDNITPAAMSRRLGISEPMMSLMLKGKRRPGLDTLIAIKKVYPNIFDEIFNS
jgi:transcriptional regulator with XRE-family HTH domain